jgi:hypothetical protein
MSSIDRLHKFAELLCRAIPDFDLTSLSPRPPDDPSSLVHVGRLRPPGGEPGTVRALFAVSSVSNFVPFALTTCADTDVALSLSTIPGYADARPSPPVGGAFGLDDKDALRKLGIAGLMLLTPGMIEALSEFQDGIAMDGEAFEPRLVVYLDAADLELARADFAALMAKFKASGRSVLLSRTDFPPR